MIGPWVTKIVPRDPSVGEIIGSQIGAAFGSTLGQVLAGDNVFAQIGAQSVLGTALGDLGKALGGFSEYGGDLLSALEGSFDKFGSELLTSLRRNGGGSLSALLVAELSGALDLPQDFGGQLLSSVGNRVTGVVLNNALAMLDPSSSVSSLFEGVGPGVVTAVGPFLGAWLAHQVVEPKTVAGAIGGQIGGAIGSGLGATFAGSLGVDVLTSIGLGEAIGQFGVNLLSQILLPGVGAFVGVILGAVLGDALAPVINDIMDDWFGQDPPRAGVGYGYDAAKGEFVANTWREAQAGGHLQACIDMTRAAADVLNMYKEAVGGTLINGASLGHRFYIWEDHKPPFFVDSGASRHYDNAKDAVSFGVLASLKTMQVAGGDLYVKRAIANSKADTLEALNGDIQVALDYSRYMENKGLIDLLIAMDPRSAFAAGWLVTLVRAEEIGIAQWSNSDFHGGLGGFLSSISLDKWGATPDNVAISIDGAALKLDVVVSGQIVRSFTITDFANKIGYARIAAAFDGSAVNGAAGNDVWIARDVASVFNDAATASAGSSNDILIGGTGNDAINAGPGWDFVRGGAGNDAIAGGSGDDRLYGGDGDDALYGEDSQPLAPLPTTAQSDTAAANAAKAIDESRRTWFGGSVQTASFTNDEIHGGGGIDQIAGGAGDDRLYGDAGDDVVYGDAGNDLLVGGAGADVLYGGAGFDTASYEDATTGVTVDLAGTAVYGTSSDGDKLYSVEDLIGGKFNDVLYGDAYANVIDGGMGSDSIDGRGGRDAISFASSLYGVTVDMQAGTATTIIPAFGAAAASIDTDAFVNIEDVIGSSHKDILKGSSAGGALDGAGGDDVIIIINDDVDVAGGAAAYDVRGGDGIDALDFSTWAKARGVQISLAGATGGNQITGVEKVIGSAFADRLTGSDEADILQGGLGNDVLDGGKGKDIHLVNRGDGADTVAAASAQIVDYGGRRGLGKVVTGRIYGDSALAGDSIVLGSGVTYHDIFGTFTGVDQNLLALPNQNYTLGRLPFTRQELLDSLGSVDLTIGVKAPGVGFITDPKTVLANLQTTVTIQAGGVLSGALATRIGAGATKATLAGADWLTYTFDTTTSIVERLGFAGSAPIDISRIKYFKDGSAFNDLLLQAADGQATWLYGGDGADQILGAGQGDVIVGGAGADLLDGGAGNDQYAYWLGDGDDVITDLSGKDTIVFGGGIASNNLKIKIGKLANASDHASFRDALPGEFNRDLRLEIHDPTSNALSGTITIVDFQNALTFSDRLRFAGDVEISLQDFLSRQGVALPPSFAGAAGDDTLTGTAASEAFYGLDGNDVMNGGDGDDRFYSQGGSDVISGGSGSDTVDYSLQTKGVTIDLRRGRAMKSDGATDRLTGVDNVNGSDFNDAIAGDAYDNILAGGKGDDLISGWGGADAIVGGEGNDRVDAGAGDDVIYGGPGNDSIDGGAGTDTLNYAALASAVAINIQTGKATSGAKTDAFSNVETFIGSSLNDTLTGSTYKAMLDGGAGDDVFILQSDDIDLIAGAAIVTVMGGLGIDTLDYSGWSKGRGVTVDAGLKVFTDRRGSATVGSTKPDAMRVYNSIERLIGSSLNDTLKGSDRPVALSGGAGDDLLESGEGAATMDGGAGVDVVDYSASTAGVAIDLSAGKGAGGFAAGDTLAGVENLIGSAFGDRLLGDAADNTLTGLAGDDTLQGGSGDDTYVIHAGDGVDTITERSGTDRVDVRDSIAPDELWFAHEENNLVMYHLGSDDKTVFKDWFASTANQVEMLSANNGDVVLDAADVNNLISQMATFSAQIGANPSAVQPSQLPNEYSVAVNSVWHSAV